MALSSVQGGLPPTSGSDAGNLPPLRTVFTYTGDEAEAALTTRPLSDSLDEALFRLLEQASQGAQDPDPEQFARELTDALVAHPLGGIDGLADLGDQVEDIDGDGLKTYLRRWIRAMCGGHGKALLGHEAAATIERYIPSLVSGTVLHIDFIKVLPSAPRLAKECRWQILSAKRELKSLRQSPFSKGWWSRSLQEPQSVAAFQTPISEVSQVTPRREVRTSDEDGFSRRTSAHTGGPVASVSQQRRQTAAKDADKASTAFDGGPFKGVGDPRGFSGFWRQLEGKLLRRGWDHGGPEHFYLLTSLLPENLVNKTVGKAAPTTLSGFKTTVEELHTALSREYGGSVEVEKLLTESIVRGRNETLTDFIARIDNWEDRCSTAGSPVPDATLIQTYRSGVNHEASREASYEYPCRWTDFRLRALTRAARVDNGKRPKSDSQPQEQLGSRTSQRPATTSSSSSSSRPAPDKKGEVCRNNLRGRCVRGDKCPYKHIDREACRLWEERGQCRFGESCKFRHDRSSQQAGTSAGEKPSAGGRQRDQLKTISNEEGAAQNDTTAAEEEVQRIWAMSEHVEGSDSTPRPSGPLFNLRFPDGSPPLRALLDSGAVRNYITVDEAQSRGWHVEPITAFARLADNSKVELHGKVQVTVSVAGGSREMTFHILPREEGRSHTPICILGVRSMCDLGISLQFSEAAGERQVVVKQSSSGRGPAAVAESVPNGKLSKPTVSSDGEDGPDDRQVRILGETLTVTASGDEDEEALYCVAARNNTGNSVDEETLLEVSADFSEAKHALCSSWRPVRAAPDYSVRLRRLGYDEIRDCEGQTHAVEATWALGQPLEHSRRDGPTTVFDYSRSLYSRLNSEQQAAFDGEISKFTTRGWWEKVGNQDSLKDGDITIPEAVAFPVVQGSKTRPCVDMRKANGTFPSSSYAGRSCSVILAQLRLAIAQVTARAKDRTECPRLAMATMDAETAFYRIRLSGVTAQVRCLGQRYAVRRLLFGHRAGPAILEEAMSGLLTAAVAKVEHSQLDDHKPPLYCWAYVDDITLLGEVVAVKSLYSAIIATGAAWGFTFSERKTHWVFFGSDGFCDDFDDFRHLGVRFLCVRCEGGRTIRLQCLPSSLSPRKLSAGDLVSKREAFRWAGAGYDVLGLHPEGSLAADLIRRASGKWSPTSWDEKVAISEEDAQTITIACSRLAERNELCQHDIAFSGTTLTITTDASPYGMGFCLSIGTASGGQVALCGKAKCWRGSQVSWHQNRQEAYCLGLSFVFCDALIPYCNGLTVRFLTDSRTALSWMRGGERMTSRSIERIAISRLCDAVADLKEVWARRYDIHPVVEHFPAEQNSQADILSRLAHSWNIPQVVIFDGRFKGSKGAANTARKVITPLPSQALAGSGSQSTVADEAGELDTVSAVIFAISEDHAPRVPDDLRVGAGQPDRKRLLDLQRGSPEVSAIIDRIRGADGASEPNDLEFVLAGDGVLMRRCRSNTWNSSSRLCFYVPSDSQDGIDYARRLLRSYHNDSGCLNARYVRWIFSRAFFVKGLRKLAIEVCRSCDQCQFAHNKRYYSLRDGGRNLSQGAHGCWDIVSADLAEMGPDRKGTYTSALFLVDHFSRFALVAPLRSSSSSSVIGALSTFISIFGPMGRLRSDRGPCFRGRKFMEFMASQGVVHQQLPPYAAFSNGLVERSVSAIKFITRQLASKRAWSTQIHRVIARLNAKPLDGVDLSPHEIFFARPRRFPVENALQSPGSVAPTPADAEQARQRREDGDYLDRLVADAIKASTTTSSARRFVPRRGPPKVGAEVLVFTPSPMGGGSYGREVYRVHGITGGVTLQLVKSTIPPSSVRPDMIKEVHYFNTRPYYRSSGGHVRANQ